MLKRHFNFGLSFLKLPVKSFNLPLDIKLCVSCICISFVILSLAKNSSQLRELSLSVESFFWLLQGILFSLISLVVNAIAWKSLLNWQGHRVVDLPLIGLFLKSNLLKYLPGGVWHFVERIRVLRFHVGGASAVYFVLFEPLLMVVAALLLVPFGGWQSGLGACCCLPSLMLLPQCRKPLLRLFRGVKLKQMKKLENELTSSIDFSKHLDQAANYPFGPLGLEMLFVFSRFLGFWFCLKAFSLTTQISFGQWLAAFAIAWTAGLVVPAAPGGIGVFETVIFLRLGGLVTEAPLLAAVVSYRFASTIADILAAVLSPGKLPFLKTLRKNC